MTERDITGRDGYITAKALWMGIKSTKAKPDFLPESSDAEDMAAILLNRYPAFAAQFAFEDDLERAMRCGFEPHEGKFYSHNDIKEFLAKLNNKDA